MSGDGEKPNNCGARKCLPSYDNKIHEAVNAGSIYLALEKQFVTPDCLLDWLVSVPYTERTLIAYKAVCFYISPNDQYLDEIHFLVKKPEYVSIAIAFNVNLELPATKSNNGESILTCVLGEIIKYNNNINTRIVSGLILGAVGDVGYLLDNLSTCYLARNFPYFRDLSGHDCNVGLVEADWPERFRYNDTLAHLILRRVVKLQDIAPHYYARVAYQTYHPIIVKLNKEKLLTKLSRDELHTLNTFFPNIIDTRILQYDNLAYSIALLTNDVAGYVLGFPIQSMIPNDEQIHQALAELTSLGPERYADRIKNYVSKTYTPSLPFYQEKETVYPNSTDVLFEEIDNYSPFDIIACQIGSHIHRFSRAEASKLLESKKNPWNGEWLPPTVLSTFSARVKGAKELGLPPARTIKEMLERAEKGTLFTPDEEVEPKSPQPDSLQVPFRFFLSALFQPQQWIATFNDEEAVNEAFLDLDENDNLMDDVTQLSSID